MKWQKTGGYSYQPRYICSLKIKIKIKIKLHFWQLKSVLAAVASDFDDVISEFAARKMRKNSIVMV